MNYPTGLQYMYNQSCQNEHILTYMLQTCLSYFYWRAYPEILGGGGGGNGGLINGYM